MVAVTAAASALGALPALVRDTPVRVAAITHRTAASSTVWVDAELGAQLRPSDADVNIVLTDNGGAILASRREHLTKDVRSLRSTLTPTAAPADGQFVVRVSLQSSSGDWDQVTSSDTLPATEGPLSGGVLLRSPLSPF